MDFEVSERVAVLHESLVDFLEHAVIPAEPVFDEQLAALGDPHGDPPVLEELKAEARKRGLWNLFLPHHTLWSEGFSNVDYASLSEVMGRSPIASEACNCSAPDTGNMEILELFGTPAQKEQWLRPLLAGDIRSAFAMTEPAVASSDATNIECSIVRDGKDYVINGRKWWVSGAGRGRCRVLIVLGRTDAGAPRHKQHSTVLVPVDAAGLRIVRNLPVYGYVDREGHWEIEFRDVRVPAGNLLGGEGEGFAVGQARLGPGRIHHCMRMIGMAERALQLMCERVTGRSAFGSSLAEKGTIQDWIADARIDITEARLHTLYTAWLMDRVGNKAAAAEISAIKVAVPRAVLRIIDCAIQSFGAAGVGPDAGLARMWAHVRTLRIADGPDEVHRRLVARRELSRYAGRL
jgi:acyl-CoA dehydrogenase